MAFLCICENRIQFAPLLLVLLPLHGWLETYFVDASRTCTSSRFLRYLYPEKSGSVTLGKNGTSRLYLVCGRAGAEHHRHKHPADTILARSTRKRLQATTTDASNNPKCCFISAR